MKKSVSTMQQISGSRMISSICLIGCLTGCAVRGGTRDASVLNPPPQTTTESPTAPIKPPDVNDASFQRERDQFVTETATRFGLDRDTVRATLDSAVFQPEIVTAMQRPAERAKNWSEYRAFFLTEQRVSGGRQFVQKNAGWLRKTARQSGVPVEIIAAIIGVESQYGTNAGNYRVLDALFTLAFRYPIREDAQFTAKDQKRALYFRDELAQFFALCHEQGLNPAEVKGSYAGAIGLGQFMPSSYRAYAVDGDGDGRRDLLTNAADAIASIGNYLNKSGGWKAGGQIAVPATLEQGHAPIESDDLVAKYSLSELSARGYHAQLPVKVGQLASPLTLQTTKGAEYWLGFQNFYAITRYNHSLQYAMTIFQLGQAISGRQVAATSP